MLLKDRVIAKMGKMNGTLNGTLNELVNELVNEPVNEGINVIERQGSRKDGVWAVK